jgi:hypothetical protein
MTMLLLAEEIFLLTHNAESGKASGELALDNGLAGALLLDLAADELIDVDGKAITAVAGTARHPLLAKAHAALLGSDRPRSAQYWVNRLPGALKPLSSQVGQSLAERGALAEHHRKILGVIPTTSWPEVDPGPERELRQRLTGVLVTGAEPDTRTALLISLLSPLGLIPPLVDRADRKQAESRAKGIAATTTTAASTSAAVSRAVHAVQAGIVVAAIMPSIAATTS